MGKKNTNVKVYYGYGHSEDLVVYGHVLKNMPGQPGTESKPWWKNIFHLGRLFFVKPVANAQVQLCWNQQVLKTTTEHDGFFKFEWRSAEHVAAGWHDLEVVHLNGQNEVLAEGKGRIFVPHVTQYAFVSDVDDTIMISHSATIFKRLGELFGKSAKDRTLFAGVGKFYQMLALSNTVAETPNPFFYVSSSEWNLYDYLRQVFRHNHLPAGTFMLSQLKQWFQLVKTGKTKHEAKLLRIIRIFKTFPLQEFVLLGDNTQQDPYIYEAIIAKYPGKVHAVYIRNVSSEHEPRTRAVLDGLRQKGVHVCLFNNSREAMEHAIEIGLITGPMAKNI